MVVPVRLQETVAATVKSIKAVADIRPQLYVRPEAT